MWSKQLILTMIQGDVEEFRRLLKNETERNLNLFYINYCADFAENKIHGILYDAGAFYSNHFNVSLLHVAAAIKNIKFVKLLIEAGCDVNSGNQLMQTPLFIAIPPFRVSISADEMRKSVSIIKFLLDNGANVNHEDFSDTSPLLRAAIIENPTIARMLIAKGACVNKCNVSRVAPLHRAAQYGSISVVKLLLDNGADIYSTDSRGEAPFTRATQRSDLCSYDVMRLLLEKNGKCDKTRFYASKALPFALSNCDLRTIKLLSDYGAHIIKDIRENFTLLLPEVIDQYHRENFTKLHYAAMSRHVDVIKYVLENSTDVNVRSTSNRTPLHIAADYGRDEGCKLLLSEGANVNCIDDCGHTPFYSAIKSNMFRILNNFNMGGYDTYPKRRDNNIVINIFIEHIAKLVFSNIWVNEIDIEVIEQNYEIKCYYENCMKELEKMKIHKVYESLSLFDILTKKDIASGLAKNEDLIGALDSAENELNHDFPIYYSSLKEDFYQEIKKQRSIKGAAIVLNEIFNFYDPFHLANLKILSYLREDDIIRINETK